MMINKLKNLFALGICGITMCSCGNTAIKDHPLSETTPLPETSEIFLISRYVNYAWGYDDKGIFADTGGDVYAFDFSMEIGSGSYKENMIEKFDILRDCTEPIFTIDSDDVSQLYSLGCLIDTNSELKSEFTACDAGSRTISFRDPDSGKITVCTESGDSTGTLNDKYAEDLVKLFEKIIAGKSTKNTEYPLIYTADAVYMDSIECNTQTNGKYLLSNDDQLHILAEQLNIPVDNILDDYNEYEYGRYVYFVELNAPPANAILKIGDEYGFSHKEGAGYCNIAAFPRKSGIFTDEIISCTDGGVWERLKDGDLNYDPDFIKGEAYGFSESAMRNVWKETYMHGFKGIYIPDKKKYEDFVKLCDDNALSENGSISDILEENGTIDFEKYTLCVKLDSHNDNTKYSWNRTEIGDRYIVMGSSISLNWDNTEGECTLAYVLIPKTYLSDDEYTVSCQNPNE